VRWRIGPQQLVAAPTTGLHDLTNTGRWPVTPQPSPPFQLLLQGQHGGVDRKPEAQKGFMLSAAGLVLAQLPQLNPEQGQAGNAGVRGGRGRNGENTRDLEERSF
jgi:hypothetical protein